MRNVVLTRVDERLIHGQVMTSWLKLCNANVKPLPILVSELPSYVQCPMTKTASSCCGMEQSG